MRGMFVEGWGYAQGDFEVVVGSEDFEFCATACISAAAKNKEAEEPCPPIHDFLSLAKLKRRGPFVTIIPQ